MNSNPIFLITGGGRGLGRAIALGAAQTGAQVAVTARSASELTETVELIQQAGGRALALLADVTDHHAVVRMVAAVESQLGPIDVLINSAGSFRALGNAAQVDPAEWWREVEINLRGPFLCSHVVLPGMMARRSGRIINVASAAGLQAIETVSAYGVSKAALIRLTEALAAETGPYGITRPGSQSRHDSHLNERLCTQRAPGAGTCADGATMVSAALCRGRGYADRAGRCVYARSGFRASGCFVRLLSERGRRLGGRGR
jgi:NADP-dependent 3-hydroxy acid dehydrogenase YdfG